MQDDEDELLADLDCLRPTLKAGTAAEPASSAGLDCISHEQHSSARAGLDEQDGGHSMQQRNSSQLLEMVPDTLDIFADPGGYQAPSHAAGLPGEAEPEALELQDQEDNPSWQPQPSVSGRDAECPGAETPDTGNRAEPGAAARKIPQSFKRLRNLAADQRKDSHRLLGQQSSAGEDSAARRGAAVFDDWEDDEEVHQVTMTCQRWPIIRLISPAIVLDCVSIYRAAA